MAQRRRSCSHDGSEIRSPASRAASHYRSSSFDRIYLTEPFTRLCIQPDHSRLSLSPQQNISVESSELSDDLIRDRDHRAQDGPNLNLGPDLEDTSQVGLSTTEYPDGENSPVELKQPFRLMDLPTEIRLEIYRACLTRPYKILLAKQETNLTPVQSENCNSDLADDLQSPRERLNRIGIRDGSIPSIGSADRPSIQRRSRAGQINSNNPISVTSGHNLFAESTSVQYPHDYINLPTTRERRIGAIVRRQELRERALRVTPVKPARSSRKRPHDDDPLLVNLLRTCSSIYKEARAVLYGENVFLLELDSAMETLACLHQRSRRQIRYVELEIPTFNEILDRFQETVRLSLRYCSGLKRFEVNMPFILPGADGSGTTGNTSVYANGFDILRWLPQDCDVVVHGKACTEVDDVVSKHLLLARTLNKLAYARRQLIATDTTSGDKV